MTPDRDPKDATVAVIGLGYVGLPLAVELAKVVEVIGYDMSGPTPAPMQRFPTVQNPYTLGVDPATGRLFVAGVSGGVVQIIDPG